MARKILNRKLETENWKFIILLSVSCFLLSASFSQETLTDLTANPTLLSKYHELQTEKVKNKEKNLTSLSLPFLDDFSKDDIYPDTSLWLDSNVFINRDYPIAPPTLGVATFDGVSKSGLPYDTNLISSTASYPADVLTSRPINLASPSANIFLSFFWQAKGRGNDPEHYDSLLLDFLNPTNQQWKNIWYKNGYNPSPPDTGFHFVMLPVTDTSFLKNNFQFRFRNYATINGNVDHWHIDYVYLDQNRNAGDTVFSDAAFVYNSPSLLKNYYAMPWEQYKPSEMKTNLGFFIRNNDTVQKNTFFKYTIYNNTGVPQANFNAGSWNVPTYLSNLYLNYPPITNPPVGNNIPLPFTSYSFPNLTDTSSYSFEYILNTSPDKNNRNDTVRFKQKFYNYYAYDDGTAEAGYGLNDYGGQIAYRFSLNNPDTLVAVQFLFNWIVTNVNQRLFKIRVWNDAGGVPGSVIYESGMVTPNYMYIDYPNNGNETNLFYPYIFSSPKALPAGTFYVGWIQYTADLLNVGYDENTNSQGKMFYNVGSGWAQSSLAIKGSWMIRPVFGNTNGLLPVNEQHQETFTRSFSISPNPFSESTILRITDTGQLRVTNYELKIYNVFGQEVYPSVIRNSDSFVICSGNLPQGIYFVIIKDNKGISYSQKLIISR